MQRFVSKQFHVTGEESEKLKAIAKHFGMTQTQLLHRMVEAAIDRGTEEVFVIEWGTRREEHPDGPMLTRLGQGCWPSWLQTLVGVAVPDESDTR